jgi:cyclohexanone monooxygenase
MIGGPNSPIGNFSFIMTAETQMGYICGLIRLIASGEAPSLSPRSTVVDAFYRDLNRQMTKTIWASGCRNWYMNKRDEIASWPWTFEHFQSMLASPDLADFDIADHASAA